MNRNSCEAKGKRFHISSMKIEIINMQRETLYYIDYTGCFMFKELLYRVFQ